MGTPPQKSPDWNAATVLPAVATAAAPTNGEGGAVCLSTDLAGSLRTTAIGTVSTVITDGSSAGEADVIGTAPTGSEQGLVTRPYISNRTSTGSLTAATQRVSLSIEGYAGAGFTITGTWTGTLTAQISFDGGSTWLTSSYYRLINTVPPISSITVSNESGEFLSTRGATHVGVYATALSSGSASVLLVATTQAAPRFQSVGIADNSGTAFGITNPLATTGPLNEQSTTISSAPNVLVLLGQQYGTHTLDVSGTWTGSISVYADNSGAVWSAAGTVPLYCLPSSGVPVTAITANGVFQIDAAGYSYVAVWVETLSSGSVTLYSTDSTAGTSRNPLLDIATATTTPGGSDRGLVIRGAGTFAATQSGTWTVQPGNTPNTTPWLVDNRRGQTIMYAAISTATSGDQTIISADATKKIKVLSYVVVADGTVAITWKRGSTAMSGAMSLVVNTGVASPLGFPGGGSIFETAANEALVLNLSASIGVRGHLSYYLET